MSETKPDERKSPPATPLVNSQQGNTLLLSPASPSPSDPAIVRAADLLASGRLVAFPTETVYGLGADATNACASAEIFEAKGRPSSNPVIVHVADAGAARALAVVWPPAAEVLAAAFWPGPLTLVVESVAAIAPGVRAGGPTVGLRVPAHPVALALLRACGKPIAAPSANRSMRISPTTAQAVLDELGGRIEAVLDGGPCDVGIESTVVDVTGGRVRVLRPGMIGAGVIARVAGDLSAGERSSGPARSPGQMLRHYAPRIPLRLVPEGGAPDGAFVIARTGAAGLRRAVLPAEPAGFARELYAALRAAESSGAGEIALELPPAAPEWAAIHDRLRRAAAADPTQ